MRIRALATAFLAGVIPFINGAAQVSETEVGSGTAQVTSGAARSLAETRLVLSLGAVENLQFISPQFVVYPELEVYRSLYQWKEAAVTVGGSLYAAGWTDRALPTWRCSDCPSYGHTSAILGFRSAFRLDHFPLPLSFWGGLAYHSIWSRDVGGSRNDAQRGARDRWTWSYAVESGARLEIPLTTRFALEPKGHVILILPYGEPQPARLAWTVGLSYSV